MKGQKTPTVYLDSHATTPVDQDVLNSMLPYFTHKFANGNHKAGWETAAALEAARHQVASYLGARPSEITFTSGATESINLALLGLADSNPQSRRHIITQRTEHSAVLRCVDALGRKGFRVSMLEVDTVGRIDLNQLNDAISNDTLAVAIMLANNEIGTVQPVQQIGEICRKWNTKFFCDLTQGLGWHPIDVDSMHIDLAAISAHKIYGPRGVGALFSRRKGNKVSLNPICFGGGQERGLRPGTSNIPAAVGFGTAIDILANTAISDFKSIQKMRDQLEAQLFSTLEGIQLNGCPINRHPGNLNISIPGVSGEELIGALPNLIFSTGSACTSGSAQPSHVLSALRTDPSLRNKAFRFGIGKYNTMEEIDYVGEAIVERVQALKARRKRITIA